MDNKKYEFTGEEKTISIEIGSEVTVRRIRRIYDGLMGGWIEKESNLSHEGSCFVYDNATVTGNANILENATVRGYALVTGYATVFGSATVSENATVFGYATISGDVCGGTEIW